MVESQPSKLLVAGSIPVSRSILFDSSPSLLPSAVARGGTKHVTILTRKQLRDLRIEWLYPKLVKAN
jgi:hypothetical protein